MPHDWANLEKQEKALIIAAIDTRVKAEEKARKKAEEKAR